MKYPKEDGEGNLFLHGHLVSVDLSPELPFEPSEVNGALISDEAYNDGVRFLNPIINEDGYAVSNLEMTVPHGLKMGQVFDRVPYGIINKTITGFGATTLEIMSQVRSSIIVVPTKTLAYTKVKSANEQNGEGYAMYIGSPIGTIKSNIKVDHVKEYIKNKGEEGILKFIVVADSLPMLLNYLEKLEVNVYDTFFLMVDEIDTMQADSSYRPRLEIVIDHYFKFDFSNRAVVSATIIPFSNPRFSKESALKIMWNVQPKRDIKVQYSNYVEDAAINEINYLTDTTKDKILVAYNSLDGIFNIIDQLNIKKEDCGILCGDRSSDKVADYKEEPENAIDEKGNLLKRVTFMTCAYFAGMDIMDKCHLITLSSKTEPYTYLSVNQMTQIAGRCRNGNLSETILYDIPEKLDYAKENCVNEFRNNLLEKAGKYTRFLNNALEMIDTDVDLQPMKHFVLSLMDYISKAKPSKTEYPLTIIRQDSLKDEYVTAYFNIDALTEKWSLRHSLYIREGELANALKKEGHNVEEKTPYLQKKEEHIVPNKEARKTLTDARRAKILEQLKQELIDWSTNHGNNYALEEISRKVEKRMQDTIIYGFKVLHQFYSTSELLDFLIKGYWHGRGFKNIYNAAVFHALPLDDAFKAKVLLKFGCDNATGESNCWITPAQRTNLIAECFIEVFKVKPKTHNTNLASLATSFLDFKTSKGQLCATKLNPQNLPMPIMTIPAGQLSPNLFMLPYKS